MGLGPKWAAIGTVAGDAGDAHVSCIVTPQDPGGGLRLMLRDPAGSYGASARRPVRVSVDGEPFASIELAGQVIQEVPLDRMAFARGSARVDVELAPRPASVVGRVSDAPVQFDFARR